MFAYFHKYDFLLKWLGIVSVIMFAASILLIPWLIGRLPHDYFIRKKSTSPNRVSPSLNQLILAVFRNIAGALLLLAGIAMLVLPGQGILTVILGLSMVNFPGRQKLIQNLIQRSSVQQALNWIRIKTSRPPFLWTRED
jgi:ABC-type multidrug transport system fused ATPase/permease subunit